jgi:hypothetical protein
MSKKSSCNKQLFYLHCLSQNGKPAHCVLAVKRYQLVYDMAAIRRYSHDFLHFDSDGYMQALPTNI